MFRRVSSSFSPFSRDKAQAPGPRRQGCREARLNNGSTATRKVKRRTKLLYSTGTRPTHKTSTLNTQLWPIHQHPTDVASTLNTQLWPIQQHTLRNTQHTHACSERRTLYTFNAVQLSLSSSRPAWAARGARPLPRRRARRRRLDVARRP